MNRLRGGDAAGGVRIFDKLTNTMLYAPWNPPDTPFEYLDGDDGVDDGQSPQGWDGSCFLRTSVGMLGWMPESEVELHPALGFPDDARTLGSSAGYSRRLMRGMPDGGAGDEEHVFHVTLPAAWMLPAAGLTTMLPLTRGVTLRSQRAFLRLETAGGKSSPASVRLSVVAGVAVSPTSHSGRNSKLPFGHSWEFSSECVRRAVLGEGANAAAPAAAYFVCDLESADIASLGIRVGVLVRTALGGEALSL